MWHGALGLQHPRSGQREGVRCSDSTPASTPGAQNFTVLGMDQCQSDRQSSYRQQLALRHGGGHY